MTTSSNSTAPKQRRRIPTGSPRLVESSADRREREVVETWSTLLDAIRRSSEVRLELLRGRSSRDLVACPWARLAACTGHCRCCGAGTVTVGFLRDHYDRLAAEIAVLVRPGLASRKSS